MTKTLSYQQAFDLQNNILLGQLSQGEILQLFTDLAAQPLAVEEFRGFVAASKANMIRVDTDLACLDIVGTGGDKLNTINISTAASIVCAAAGVNVAKHGNRAATSKCGSADVLEALGVNINLNAIAAKKCLEKAGIVFLFAPNFHPAFKNAAAARKEFGQPTYFNFLGPLLNPASPKFQVIGVANQYMKGLMLETLAKSKNTEVMLVSSDDGMDELSTTSSNSLTRLHNGQVSKSIIDPQMLSLSKAMMADIQGGDVTKNAETILAILKGKANVQQTEIVALNSAAGLLVSGKVQSLKTGIAVALDIISSGKALNKLNEFIKVSNEV